MPRKPAPPGYYTASEAIEKLHITEGMFYKYIGSGKLKRYMPETRKQGFYKISEVDKLAAIDSAFFGELPPPDLDGVFTQAAAWDMDGVATLAKRELDSQIDADLRRAWLAREPRLNYVVKLADGTVVAYLYMQPLQHDRLIAYQKGDIRGWHITTDDIEPFEPGQARVVMIGGIASDSRVDEKRRSAYVALLIRGAMRDMARLAREEGVTISRLYAYSSTLEGIAMCLDLEMERWGRPTRNAEGKPRCTFALDMTQSESLFFKPYKASLAEWKRKHHLATHPQKTALRPVQAPKQASEKSTMPSGLVGWRAFSRLHSIGESTTQAAIETGRLGVVPGTWIVGRASVKGALDQAGRAKFYELYHDKPQFKPCEQCPHML